MSDDQTRQDTSDAAELDERDRSQPDLVTRQANRRAEDDATPDRSERQAAIDELEEDG